MAIDFQMALLSDQHEVAIELQQKGLQALDQRRLELALGSTRP